MRAIGCNGGLCSFRRRIAAGRVGEHPTPPCPSLPATNMPISSASSDDVAAGSIATTTLTNVGASPARAASMTPRLHRAPGTSSRSSASSSWRPRCVPSYFADDLIQEGGLQIGAVLISRATCYHGRRDRRSAPGINLVGRGVVVTTRRGSFPDRNPNISMSRASGTASCGASHTMWLHAAARAGVRLIGAVERRDGAVRPGRRRFDGS